MFPEHYRERRSSRGDEALISGAENGSRYSRERAGVRGNGASDGRHGFVRLQGYGYTLYCPPSETPCHLSIDASRDFLACRRGPEFRMVRGPQILANYGDF